MTTSIARRSVTPLLLVAMISLIAYRFAGAEGEVTPLPNPAVDAVLAAGKGPQIAVIAGGCFWGIQGVYQHVNGVISVTSGYSGGARETADYERVSSGSSGHAEAVKIVYDPAKISYGQLLKIYFSVAHDPTQLNRQGPDRGTQYRSEIFYANDEQKRIALAYINQLQGLKAYAKPIVTKVSSLAAFYPAEAYHQDYLRLNPNQPYIVFNDLPKIANLKTTFPAIYTSEWASTK